MLLDIQLNDEGNVLTVKVDGDIDVNSVRQLRKSLEESIEKDKPSITLDCKKLNYIDSTGLGVLVSLLKQVQQYEGSIRIIALKPYLNKIFEVTGLTNIFDIEVAD